MNGLFYEILYRPLFNALIFLYQYIAFYDLGAAIILLTVLIRFVLLPLFYKSVKDQMILQRLMPQLKEIQNRHKSDRQKQAKATLELYRQHKVNPFISQILLLLIQLPILIALYQIFWKGIQSVPSGILYSFIAQPPALNHTFFNLVDLSQPNNFIIGLAAIAQYLQGKLSLPPASQSQKEITPAQIIGRQMVFMAPILTIVILYALKLPSAVGLYWIVTTIFSAIQQLVIKKQLNRQHSQYGKSNITK